MRGGTAAEARQRRLDLRAWAGAEDAAESERKSVRSENFDSGSDDSC